MADLIQYFVDDLLRCGTCGRINPGRGVVLAQPPEQGLATCMDCFAIFKQRLAEIMAERKARR